MHKYIFFILVLASLSWAGWTKVVVDSGSYQSQYLVLGNGRNDDTVRLYWTSEDGFLREATYRNGSWDKGVIGTAGTCLIISPARNDGVSRIYTLKSNILTEYSWSGDIWIKVSYPLPDSSYQFIAAPLRNDDTIRIYLFPHEYQLTSCFELTWRWGDWEITKTDSFPEPIGYHLSVANGRNDDTLRLYTMTQRIACSFNEITYSLNQWREETWIFGSGYDYGVNTSLILGKTRKDGIFRLYIDHTYSFTAIQGAWIFEYTFTLSNWSNTGTVYSLPDNYPVATPPYPLLIDNCKGDDTTRLYASIVSFNSEDTLNGLHEFAYYPTGWKREKIDSKTVTTLTAGHGRNDDTNRLYGIQSNKIIELSWSPTGVEEKVKSIAGYPILRIEPNPFSKTTKISSENRVASSEETTIRIYDVAGKLIKSFSLAPQSSLFATTITWDGSSDSGEPVSPGVYFCRLETKDYLVTKKIVRVR